MEQFVAATESGGASPGSKYASSGRAHSAESRRRVARRPVMEIVDMTNNDETSGRIFVAELISPPMTVEDFVWVPFEILMLSPAYSEFWPRRKKASPIVTYTRELVNTIYRIGCEKYLRENYPQFIEYGYLPKDWVPSHENLDERLLCAGSRPRRRIFQSPCPVAPHRVWKGAWCRGGSRSAAARDPRCALWGPAKAA
jgi:hypothetical protein